MSQFDYLSRNMLSLPQIPAQILPLCDTPTQGKKILFFEAYQESGDGFGDERISFDQNSAAMVRAWVNWDAVSDPDLARILRTSLVGGYYPPLDKKIAPWKHPYLPGLYVKDIVSVQSVACGPQGFHGITTSIPFQLALLTLSFSSRPYTVDQPTKDDSSGNQYNPNWIELSQKVSNNHITLPFGGVNFDTSLLPALAPSYTTQGICDLVFTFHDVPAKWLFTGNNVRPVFADSIGSVNDKATFGCAPETLLADSAICEPYGDYFDPTVIHYDVTLNCVYNSIGWNKQYSVQAGDYVKLHLAGNPNLRPYLLVNFLGTFFTPINHL